MSESQTILTSKNLLLAYLDCRRSKRTTINSLKFELFQEKLLLGLKTSLINSSYFPSRSICFIVTSPKPREIFAADFSDRIIHHLIINQIEKLWEKYIFIDDSYACRKGKGHHYAASRLFEYVKKYSHYGQFDIANFFSAIDKNILFRIIALAFKNFHRPEWWKEELLNLIKIVIFNDPTQNYYYKGNPKLKAFIPLQKSLFDQPKNTGLPIGNLTSQFFANVYLNELDYFVTKTLKIPGYGRYVDDFVLLSNNKEEILNARDKIRVFLKDKLKLTLHPKKQQIQPTCHGIPFVGYFIKPWGITVRRNDVKTAKNKIYGFNKSGDEKQAVASLNSYYGHFIKARSFGLRRHLFEKHITYPLKDKVIPANGFKYIKISK